MHCNIFSIKSKFVHLTISSYIPKNKLLNIVRYSKRMQKMTNVFIEDFEVFNLSHSKKVKIFSFENRPQDSALRTVKTICDLVDVPLYVNNLEILTPTPLYAVTQLSNKKIIASTQNSLLVITPNDFRIKDEIPTNTPGAVVHIVEISPEEIIFANFIKHIKIVNLKTKTITNEITGSNPLLLSEKRLCYIWENKTIRAINLITLELVEINLPPFQGESYKNIISNMILLSNGNVLLCSWNHTILEYCIETKRQINSFKVDIDFIDKISELSDGRILFTATDNAYIFIYDQYSAQEGALVTLTGHNKEIVGVRELKNGHLVSASNDGKVKIWQRTDNTYRCCVTMYLYNDFIRAMTILHDGRICVTSDEKFLRSIGLVNYIGNFKIRYLPDNGTEKEGDSFEIIDDRFE